MSIHAKLESEMARDTRKRILDATWRLAPEDPRGTRIEDVARAAGITRQALYRRFPDRALLAEG
jgi:AcrR family transcriptional regulator